MEIVLKIWQSIVPSLMTDCTCLEHRATIYSLHDIEEGDELCIEYIQVQDMDATQRKATSLNYKLYSLGTITEHIWIRVPL